MNKKILDKVDLSDWPIRDDFLLEIGRASALWTSLENLVEMAIGKLAGFDDAVIDERAFILVHHSSFPQKLDALCALCDFLKDEHPKLGQYKKVVSTIRAAQSGRNKIVHNGISQNPDTDSFEMALGSARGKIKTDVQKVTLSDLRLISIEIDRASCELFELITGVKIPTVLERKGNGIV